VGLLIRVEPSRDLVLLEDERCVDTVADWIHGRLVLLARGLALISFETLDFPSCLDD